MLTELDDWFQEMTDDEDDDENDDEINSKDRVKGDSDYEPDELKFDEILKDLDFF